MVGTWAGTPLFAQGLLASLIRLIVVFDALFWPRRPSATLGVFDLVRPLIGIERGARGMDLRC
ncbi:MAG: hypothetical protein HOM86_02530 [Gemmatimonadetes bacterium]|jgi:hypothetical protein|nr:hypothetical protein [Gemmatimonadota bacterium]